MTAPSHGSEPGPEDHTSSYRQFEAARAQAAQTHPPARPQARRRSVGRAFIFLVVTLAVLAFLMRRPLVAWLENNPRTAPWVAAVRSGGGSAAASPDHPPLTALPTNAGAGGGERTVSVGQGFGTVTPDDGSSSFRVVVPPEGATNR